MAESITSDRSVAQERRVSEADATLHAETVRWLADLPARLRPRQLAQAYARVANEIARRWGDPGACLAFLNDVLVDRRGTRQGFPMEIALELARVKSYYETELHPTSQTVWDGIIARARH